MPPSHPLSMHETSATPIRKALGVQGVPSTRKIFGVSAYRSSRVYVNVGANNNYSSNNNSQFQGLRWPGTRKIQGFQGWMPEKGALTCNFGVSNGKLGFEFLLPNSAYKICHLHQAAGPLQRLRWPETRKIQGFSRTAVGIMSIHRQIR